MLTARSAAPAVLALLLLLPTTRAADLDPFVPADSEWILQLNVKQLVAAPAIKKHAAEQLRASVRSQSDLFAPLTALEIDPLKDVSSVTIAGSGLQKLDQALLIVRGTFDTEKVTKALNDLVKQKPAIWKSAKSGEATIYELREKTRALPAYIAVRSDGILFLSAGKKYVADALAHDPKKPSKVSDGLREWAKKADAADDVWLVAPRSEAIHRVLAKSSITQGIADDVTAFTARLKVGSDAKGAFIVHTKEKKAAEEVAQLLDAARGFASAAASNADGVGPLLSALIDECKTSTDDTTASLSGQLTEEQIVKALKNK